MRVFVFFCSLLLTISLGFSQGNPDILPVSWSLDLDTRMSPIELPPLDLRVVRVEDSINDLDKTLPWRYGITRPVDLNTETSGVWTELSNGDRIWRVAIRSPYAINMSVNFSDFYMPEGARLQMYNDDQTDYSASYSKKQNRPTNNLGSWFVRGDVIWIEYYEPVNVNENFQLAISSIIHGYRLGKVNQFVRSQRGLNDSGDCNYDVNCPVGVDFDPIKDVVKKTVALLNLGNGYLCSASLVNNTALDKKPFLLTANHCLENSNPDLWSIRFNWMSPSPICAAAEESLDIQSNFTMSGAQLRASNSRSDFALVELFNPIPESWDVAFAGWDSTDDLPEYEVGIHHPNGDIMKICRDDSGAVKDTANGTEVWLIGGVSVGSGDGWELGTTESGSSGSPLFDQNGRIIGQLYAGQSFCVDNENNDDYDIYGRFGVSWNDGSNSSSRLKDWLDPINIGSTTTETLENLLSVPDVALDGSLDIYPNPAKDYLNVMNGRYPNLSYRFYNITGQELMAGSLNASESVIDVQHLTNGIYFLHLLDEGSNQDSTKKIIINK
ncbi:MAG: lysyl endopeptidase [Candidatus Latescibacterota bacterium]|jgi:lysyl endopeptidase